MYLIQDLIYCCDNSWFYVIYRLTYLKINLDIIIFIEIIN